MMKPSEKWTSHIPFPEDPLNFFRHYMCSLVCQWVHPFILRRGLRSFICRRCAPGVRLYSRLSENKPMYVSILYSMRLAGGGKVICL
jgi:hypothetical protein